MKRSKFDETRDQIAADADGTPKHLMCSANGCPNRWSTTQGGNLCRWHADAEPHRWPEVTQQLQWDETARARLRGEHKPPAPYVSPRERREILQRLRVVLTEPKDARAWVGRLQAKRSNGAQLSAAQVHALAQVEGAHAVLNAARGGANVPAHRITAALVETGDIPSVHHYDGRFDGIPLNATEEA